MSVTAAGFERTIRRSRNMLAIAAMVSVVAAGAARADAQDATRSSDWDRVVAGIQHEIDAAIVPVEAPVETAPVATDGDDVSVIVVLLIGGGALLTGAVAGFGGGRVVARRQLAR